MSHLLHGFHIALNLVDMFVMRIAKLKVDNGHCLSVIHHTVRTTLDDLLFVFVIL